jgi:peptidoglycan/LPS O-acetylase OafA/YrhL
MLGVPGIFRANTKKYSKADMQLKYRPEIDGLRAIAVVSVVVYHAKFALSGGDLLSGGFIGVDIFFVISGFLITSLILKELKETNAFSISGFYERRIRRILPALLTVMLVSIPFAWAIMSPKALEEFSGSVISALFFGSNIWFWQTSSYTAEPSQLQPFLHTWTLSIEEQFYVIFPLMLLLLWRRLRSFLMTLLLVMFGLSLGLAHFGSAHFPDANFYLLPSRGWELLAGALVALAMQRAPAGGGIGDRFPVLNNVLPAIGLVSILWAIVAFDDTMRHPSLITAIPIAGTAMIIWFARSGSAVTRLLSSAPFVSIGLVSYSFYLWHFPVFAFARISFGTLAVSDKIILIAISFALSAFTYSMIEQPLRRRNVISRKTLYVGCGAVSAVIVALLTLVYTGAVLPKRFSDLTAYVDFKYDPLPDWREGTCFIQPQNMQQKNVFRNCQVSNYSPDKPTLLLWGDSHAAHLYRGYEAAYSDTYNIVQRTSSLCAPLPGQEVDSRPGCKEINDAVVASLGDIKPDKVVLAAAWSTKKAQQLKATIQELRALGIQNIDIVGPVPFWEGSLPVQIVDYVEKNKAFPERLSTGQVSVPYEADAVLQKLALDLNITYYSPLSILCPDKACLTRVGDKPQSITQFDLAHLTRDGSIYLVSKFKDE